jgi:sugar phosphate isomerase/epimerase
MGPWIGFSSTVMGVDAEGARLVRTAGLAHVEVRVDDLDEMVPGRRTAHADALAQMRAELGVSLSVHAFQGLNLGEKVGRVRAAIIDLVEEQLDFGERAGAAWLTLHLGTCGFGRTSPAKRDRLMIGAESVDTLLRRTAGMSVRIGLENLVRLPPEHSKCYLGDGLDDLRVLLDALPAPRMGVVFDTGHAAIDPERPVAEFLAALRPWLLALHLHANDGFADQHAPLTDDWLRGHPGLADELVGAADAGVPLVLEHHDLDPVWRGVEVLQGLFAATLAPGWPAHPLPIGADL